MSNEEAWARLAPLLRLLGAASDEEILHTVKSMQKVLVYYGMNFGDVAIRLKHAGAAAPPPPAPKPTPTRAGFVHTPNGPRSQYGADKLDAQKLYNAVDAAPDEWSSEFIESIYSWVVDQKRNLTPAQRDKVNDLLDKMEL